MKQTLKRVLSTILAVALLLSAAPLSGFLSIHLPELKWPHFSLNLPSIDWSALNIFAKAADENKCGDNATWELKDGVLIVSGSGEMYNYYWEDAPWYEQRDNIKKVVIGDGITAVGDRAFYECKNLTEVSFSESVTEIRYYAFYDCSSLASLTLPVNLRTLGSAAFACTPITSIEIPKSIKECGDDGTHYYDFEGVDTQIYWGPFGACEKLKTVTFADGVNTIPDRLFQGCVALESVTIPDSATRIGAGAFHDCLRLKSVEIGDGVTEIAYNAFKNCSQLSSVKLPKNLRTLGDQSFAKTAITSIEIPKTIKECGYSGTYVYDFDGIDTDIYYGPFGGCEKLTTVTFAEGLITVPAYLFMGCVALESVTIPDSATGIGRCAFEDCLRLKSVSIGDGVTNIEEYAFYHCAELAEVKLPKTLRTLGGDAFTNTAITTIEIPKTIKECGSSGSYYYDYDGVDKYIYYGPFGGCTKLKTVTFAEGITTIPANLMKGCVALESVTIPDTVVTIGDYAFEDCLRLKTVKIGNGVTEIGRMAFAKCASLTDVTLSNKLKTLGSNAFIDTAITKIEIPKTLRECGVEGSYTIEYNDQEYYVNYGPFGGAKNLKTVTFAEGTTRVPYSVFQGCVNLETVTIPNSVATIEQNAFSDCLRLKTLTIGTGVTSIANSAFRNCRSLTKVTIPDQVTEIGEYAFCDCASLATIQLSANLKTLGRMAFGNTSVAAVKVPKTLKECSVAGSYQVEYQDKDYYVYYGPFGGSTKLKTVTFEDGATRVANSLFRGCVYLESVTIPNSVTTIEDGAFQDCLRLKTLTVGTGVTSIGSNAFRNCQSLTKVAIPDNVTDIGEYAFYECFSLASVTLSKGLKSLGTMAFGYTAVTKIEIPKNLRECGYSGSYRIEFNDDYYDVYYGPFGGSDKLKTVTFEDGAIRVPANLFRGCVSLESVTLPDSLTTIEEAAFMDCLRLKTLKIGSGVTSIGNSAFRNCQSLPKVSIPDGVTTIGEFAFLDCFALASLTLSKSLKTLGRMAFSNTAITEVELPKSLRECGAYGSYRVEFDDQNWDIYYGPFGGCTKLTKVAFEEGTTRIVANSLRGCLNLESVVIPDTVTSIEESAFRECMRLKTATIGGSVTEIGSNAFRNCRSLTEVAIPDTVTVINEYAFLDCVKLASLKLSANLKTLGRMAFARTAVSEVEIPKTLKECGVDGWYSVNYEDVNYDIYYGPFGDCANLKTVTFENGIKKIPDNVLRGCTYVEKVTVPGTASTVGSEAFRDCFRLKEISFGKAITSLGDYALFNCFSLTDIGVDTGKMTFDPENKTITLNSHKYELVLPEGGIAWQDADALCLAQKGHLATIENAKEQFAIELLLQLNGYTDNYYQRGLWLYGTDEENEGRWSYPNGDSFSYKKWASGQPDNAGDEEDYQTIWANGYWNDMPGESTLPGYICEYDGSVGRDISIKVLDASGKDVTKNVTVNWYRQGVLTSTGTQLQNYSAAKAFSYEIVLNDALAKTYIAPQRQQVDLPEDKNVVTFTLTAVPKVKVSGTVENTDGVGVAGAKLTFTQTVNGKYTSEVTCTTDKSGKYTADVFKTATSLAVTAEEYYDGAVQNVEAAFDDSNAAALEKIVLRPLVSKRIAIGVKQEAAAVSGSQGETTAVANVDHLTFTLYNETQKKDVTAFTVQYPYILLEDTALKASDVIRITVTDPTGAATAEPVKVTLDANSNGSASLTLKENGKIALTSVTGAKGIWMVFDKDGNYIATYNGTEGAASAALPAGNYKVVLIEKTDLLRSVSTIDTLAEFGLKENTDYVVKTVTVAPGVVSELESVKVPDMDETKLYYTVPANTLFASSRYDLAQGKLATLRAEYEIEGQYADAANEYVSLRLPEGIALISGSVTLNGTLHEYDLDEKTNTVKVYTNDKSSIVRCSVAVTKDGSLTADAYLGFVLDGQNILQPIGSVKLTVSPIEFFVPEITGRSKVQISGSGIASSTVKVYDNGKLAATAESNKVGSWNATLTLSGKADEYSTHSIYAVLTSTTLGYDVTSSVKTLTYDPDYVNLSKVTMINTAHDGQTREFITTVDFLNPTNETLSYNYWPAYPTFTFIVELTTDNPDIVSDVYAVTRNAAGDVTYIPCAYDAKTGTWIGTHDFRNSREKPAAVSAVYDYKEGNKKSLTVKQLGQSYDLITEDFYIDRTYSADIDGFSRIGPFGYGWRTEYDITASVFEKNGTGYLFIDGRDFRDLLKKTGAGKYESMFADGITATTAKDNSITYAPESGTVIQFNKSGKLTEITNSTDYLKLSYTGENLTKIEQSGGVTLSVVSENGLIRSVTASDGNTVTYTYNGNYLTSVSNNGHTISYSYVTDASDKSLHALSEIRFETGSHRYFSYDSYGRVLSVCNDNRENLIEYSYPADNVVRETTGDGYEQFTFDSNDQMIQYSNSKGVGYTVTYTDTGMLDTISYTDGTSYTIHYDEKGYVVSAECVKGKEKIKPFQYERDSDSNITKIIDGNGGTTAYAWSNGQLSRITYADGTTEQYTYYDDGSIKTFTDRSGNETNYIVENGALKSVRNDAFGQMQFNADDSKSHIITSADGETRMNYDDNGNLTSVVYPDGRTIRYAFSETGLLNAVTDAEGITINYQRDKLGRLTKLTDKNGDAVVTYAYNPDSTLAKQINANGSYTEYTYKNRMLVTIKNCDKSNTVLSTVSYQYDPFGKITQMTDATGTYTYDYDILGQLIKVVDPNKVVTEYQYDAAGNRISETVGGNQIMYTVNALNQYTKRGNKTYEYDKSGNLIAETDGDNVIHYSYDAMGRLIGIDDGIDTIEYTYDVFGYRNRMIRNGEATEYIWSPIGNGQLLNTYSQDGVATSFIYGNNLTAAYLNGEAYFYQKNLIGSVTEIVDSQGKTANKYMYSAAGEVLNRTESISNPFTYAGAYGIIDDNTGLYYARSRFISAECGRFISPDSTGQCYTFNLYCYADNNPIGNIDVSGRSVLAVLAVVGLFGALNVGIDMTCDAVFDHENVFSGDYWSRNWDDNLISFAIGGATGWVGGTGWSAAAKLLTTIGLDGLKSLSQDLVNKYKDNEDISGWDMAGHAITSMALSFLFDKCSNAFENTHLGKIITDFLGMWSPTKYGHQGLLQYTFKNFWPKFTKQIPYNIVSELVSNLTKEFLQNILDWLWGLIFGIDDPSGYIYEAVRSNRVQGVTCTAITLSEWTDDYGQQQSEEVVWDAKEFDQINPMISNVFGQYAWDVPTGKWKVMYEKDGYETAYSAWLDVPPPQTEVNIGLVTTMAPAVESVSVYNDSAEILFSQYMDIESVTASAVKVTSGGKAVSGTVAPVNAEVSGDDANVQYASRFVFTPAAAMSGKVKVEVANAKNYAGIAMKTPSSREMNAIVRPKEITASKSVTAVKDDTFELEMKIDSGKAAAGSTVVVTSGSPSIVSVVSGEVAVGLDGTAKVILSANLPGNAEINYAIKGTTVSGTTKVLVNLEKEEEHTHTPGEPIRENEVAGNCSVGGSYEEVVYCTICNEEISREVKRTEKTASHTWDAGKVTKESNCKEEGEIVYTCTVCHATKTETVARSNHTWDAGTVTKQPTASEEGVRTYTCTVCGETKTEPIPKTDKPVESNVPANLGDVNGDGDIKSDDARLALRTSVKLEPTIVEGTDAYKAADVNGDGAVKSDDARTILRISVKLENLDEIKAKYGK